MTAEDTLHVMHPRAAGIDVHRMQVTATARIARESADAEIRTRESSALPNGLAAPAGWLRGHGVTAAATEGAGVYWETVYGAVAGTGATPLPPHARHVRRIKGRKTGVADSIWLARVCRFGLRSPGMAPPKAFRELRRVARARRKTVAGRTRSRVHKTVDSAGLRVGGVLSDLFGVNGRRILDGLAAGRKRSGTAASLPGHVRRHPAKIGDALESRLPEAGRFLPRDRIRLFDRAGERLAEHDAVIDEGLAGHRTEVRLLATIPGINRRAASATVMEPGPDISVFPSERHCAAWAGPAPGNSESAGKRRSGRVRRDSQALRTLPVECAQAAARSSHCQFRGYRKALTVRRGCRRATVATARKMLRIICHMLSTGELCRDPETGCEALTVMRNAPRWFRMLRKHGLPDGKDAGPATSRAPGRDGLRRQAQLPAAAGRGRKRGSPMPPEPPQTRRVPSRLGQSRSSQWSRRFC